MSISLQNQAFLYRKLAALSNVGLTAGQALAILSEESESRYVRRVLADLSKRAWEGVPLSKALAPRNGFLPRDHISVIAVGESTGLLHVVYKWLAAAADRERHLMHHVQRELRFPKITFVLALPLVVGVIEILHGRGPVAILLIALVVGFCLALLAEYLVYRLNGKSSALLDRAINALPFFRRTAMEMAQARLAGSIAELYSAGVPVSDALTLSARACGNSILCARVMNAVRGIDKGEPLVLELTKSGAIPRLFKGWYPWEKSLENYHR